MAERNSIEAELKQIEWLLDEQQLENVHSAPQPYGNLTKLNTSRLILDSVGENVLNNIAEDYLDLLATSSAIYEKNGDYALGLFSSGWCRFLDLASRQLCDTDDNQTALNCGKWHCHQACWHQSAKSAIATGEPVDIECPGGIRLYALPIYAGEEVIGSINFGYGDPPKDRQKLTEIAELYQVSVEKLEKHAHSYQSRPNFIIESAKKQLRTSAKLIGEITKRKQMEQERNQLLEREQAARAKAEAAQQQTINILETITDGFYALDHDWCYTYINRAAEPFLNMMQRTREDLIGKNIWTEFPEAVGSHFEKKYRQAIKEGVKIEFEEFYQPLDKWFQLHVYPSDNGLAIYFQDITQRKQTENDLFETQKELANQLLDLRFLHNLSIRLSTNLELSAVLEEVIRAIAKLQNADMAVVRLYDPTQNNLYVAANVGFDQEYLDLVGRIPKGQGYCGVAIAEHRSVIVEDVETDPIFAPYIKYARTGGYRAVYSLPLIRQSGEIIGAIATYFRQPHSPSEREINLVELYIQQAERTIENAQLYQKLQEAERRKDDSLAILNSLLAHAPVGFGLHDHELRYVRVNEFLAQINGLAPEAHLGLRLQDILPLELAANVNSILEGVLKTGKAVLNIEMSGETKATPGQINYWLTSYYPVPSSIGEILGVGCIVMDITDLKRTETALRESETRYKQLFDSNLIGIIESDHDKIIKANDAFLEMVGYTRQELEAGQISWRAMTPPEYLPLDEQANKDLLTKGFTNPLEKEYIRKDGSRVPILLGVTLFERSPVQFFSFVLDLTESKRAEQELRESEERLRLSLDAGEMGIWDWNIITGEITWSDNLESIHRLTPGTFDGTFEAFQRIIHPEDKEFVSQAIARAVTEVTDYDIEFRVIASDGSIQWITGKGQAFCDADGNPIRMIGVGMNITARKQVEADLRQKSEELEQANRLKDEFLAVLSHELRSPLNAIQGWAGILRTRKLDENTTNRALATIERNAKLQTQLIEDLLDVSRILRGKLSLNFFQVDLLSIVEASIDTTQLAAQAKSIDLRVNIGEFDDLLIPQFLVLGDPNRLQQIVWNLLTNAIKFTPNGGRVEVRLSILSDQAQSASSEYVQIQVSDTGKGISADFLPYVFERFRQADASITRAHGGLGLGLAIVRHLVELHGGTIQAESQGEGKGATFTVQLPWIRSYSNVDEYCWRGGKEAINPDDSLPLNKLQILVVDDDVDTRELYTSILTESGAQVIAVSSVQEALINLQKWQPDALVSDIGMPGEDGYTLIRKIRALKPELGGTIPAVALTAYAREEDRTIALNAGFQRHLSKPVEAEQLVSAIAQLTGRK